MHKKFCSLMILCLLMGLLLPLNSFANETETYLQSLPRDSRIISLDLHAPLDTSALILALKGYPSLEEVYLYEWPLDELQMAALTAAYPSVFFGFSLKIAEHTLRTDMTAFSTLHNKKSPTHTSSDFDALRYCTLLEALDLGHNAITDISFIENLTNLKVLILALNKIEDISPLARLNKLQYLEIFRNKIRDITPLESLESLLDLNLGYNYISDYSPLFKIKTLERLWLYQSNGYNAGRMNRDILAQIQEQLPQCYIDGGSAGTMGGWREHPRYDWIFEIFKTSVYRPFE